MIRIFIASLFFILFNPISIAGMATPPPPLSTNLTTVFVNGTLSITVDNAPAPGLPAPKIQVMSSFVTVYQRDVNWGDTWNLVLPSGYYRIHPFPVSNGSNFYISNSIFIFVPPNAIATSLVTYHLA